MPRVSHARIPIDVCPHVPRNAPHGAKAMPSASPTQEKQKSRPDPVLHSSGKATRIAIFFLYFFGLNRNIGNTASRAFVLIDNLCYGALSSTDNSRFVSLTLSRPSYSDG